MTTEPFRLDDAGEAIREQILALCSERVLVIDGAMGTAIQEVDPDAEAFGGEALLGCNENLVLTAPEIIRQIHDDYLAAGADLIETNTFGAMPLVLAEYDIQDRAEEINERAAELARAACDAVSTPDRPRFVLGSMGPTTKTLTVTGGTSFEELRESYRVQARGLVRGGSDVLILETVQDTLNLKAGFLGIRDAFDDLGTTRPIALSCTIEPMGTMLAGQSVEAFFLSVAHIDPLFVGMNCATGPRFMTDHLRTLASLAPCPISCFPNAGLPNEEGEYEETPDSLAEDLSKFIDEGWVNLIGGCCGTTPAHIESIANAVTGRSPRLIPLETRPGVAGIEPLFFESDSYPLIVGERTNVIGSRKFKRLIAEGAYEKGAEIGRAQVRGGAHIVDVCMADPDREELDDMNALLSLLSRMVKVPIMIDSTDEDVILAALKLCQGKSIINSINLEDGEERFEKVVPLARDYGAALVVGCIDEDPEDGMAVTVERKLEIAKRSHQLLTEKYGVPEESIIFDPLVFPVGTGDEKYVDSGWQTIEGVKAITEAFPNCLTTLGISNVSFGLPPAGREVLNSVFLYHCVKAGLSTAIVNSQKLERFAAIPDEERELCENLLFQRTADPVAEFNEYFGKRKAKKLEAASILSLPLEERLARNIIDGTKEGLEEALDSALAKYDSPLDIINGPLMTGMAEVGRLFNNNELIVAEVLQSAEAMKAAVAQLEPHMERSDSSSRGRIILATVKGDVHDIGKNLVQIILSNNGYDVVDLGIKVPPADLIEAIREHRPDAVGLSGLLVKSAQQMVVTAQDLHQAEIDVPILVGGAALSPRFTATKIAPTTDSPVVYAKDAMHGLEIANRLLDDDTRGEFLEELDRDHKRLLRGGSQKTAAPVAAHTVPARSPNVDILSELPRPATLRQNLEVSLDLERVYEYVNPQMLFVRHLGLKGSFSQLKAKGDKKAHELEQIVLELLAECRERRLLRPRILWRFFPAGSDGDSIAVFEPNDRRAAVRIPFPRQQRPPFLCLADYVAPLQGSEPVDHIGTFVTTCGSGVRELANEWMEKGEYLRAHALQALALEMAEGLAEWVHEKMRVAWGFPDPTGFSKSEMWKARYTGKRYSFGYPACPDLSQQKKLWQLLRPDDHIDVQLTDGYMMDPEASVSALVFHHPQAFYFAVKEQG